MYPKYRYEQDIDMAMHFLGKAKKALENGNYPEALDLVSFARNRCKKFDESEYYLMRRSFSKDVELTDDVVKRLQALNERLVVIEKGVADTIKRTQTLIRREAPRGRFINDYELLEVQIDYYLDEKDPDYDNEDDCIIACNHILIELFLDDGRNYNEFRYQTDHPLGEQHHCYLFYQLSRETPFVNWGDMLRIGMIWVDIRFVLQHCVTLDAHFEAQLCADRTGRVTGFEEDAAYEGQKT